jgi:hypothetical protein
MIPREVEVTVVMFFEKTLVYSVFFRIFAANNRIKKNKEE